MNVLVHPYGWTPLMIFSYLMLGILFAIGHHFFYKSLMHKPTSTETYTILGTTHSGQQLNVAVGTAFTFLVKASFTLAILTAYFQVFWKIAKQNAKTKKPLTLGQLDTAFSGATSFVPLLDAPVWLRCPLLFSMAIALWLIPIASIVPPATLSVDLRENIPRSITQEIPWIDFSNLNYLASMPSSRTTDSEGCTAFSYNGPSQTLKQIAMGVVAQTSILPIEPPFPNSSWTLDFKGPSLKCSPTSSSQSLSFQRNIAQYLQQDEGTNCYTPATYLSWLPRPKWNTLGLYDETISAQPYSPPDLTNSTSLAFMDPEAIFSFGSLSSISSQNMPTLYFAIMPAMVRSYNMWSGSAGVALSPLACSLTSNDPNYNRSGLKPDEPLASLGENMTTMQCQLYDSTYHTEFNYTNGAQSVTVDLINPEQDTTVPLIPYVQTNGSNTLGVGNCGTLPGGVYEYSVSGFDTDLFSRLSYQAVFQAFAMMMTGNITLGDSGFVDSSNIRSTGLLNTKELIYLTDQALYASASSSQGNLQNEIGMSNWSEPAGLSRSQHIKSTHSLSDAIETIFRNFTISLMSSAALRPNQSSNSPPTATVTKYITQTVYTYAADKLWAAYGAAMSITIVSVIIGISAIFLNDGSYSNAFSTILRATRTAELNVKVEESDLDGKDPLPEYLAKALVKLPHREKQPWTPDMEDSSDISKDMSSGTALLS